MTARVTFVALAALALAAPLTAQGQGQGPAPAQTAAQALAQAAPPTPEGRPIKVYLRAGLKTHAAGQHDYPQFLADWSKLLTERGAIVDGACTSRPRRSCDVDVIVMYKGDAGYMTPTRASRSRTSSSAAAASSASMTRSAPRIPSGARRIVGGAKKHGETNFTLEAPVTYTVADKADPITKGDTGLRDHRRGVLPDDVGEGSRRPRCWRRRRSRRPAAPARTPARSRRRAWTYERTFFPAWAASRRSARSSGCRATTT